MFRLIVSSFIFVAATTIAAPAATISVFGGNGAVIAAPSLLNNDTPATTTKTILAFNEAEGLLLTGALAINGGSIAAGTRIDSHMIFLNVASGKAKSVADFMFSNTILGWITGTKQVNATSKLLGTTGTTYGKLNGFEKNKNDFVTLLGGTSLRVGMAVSQPGDWMRVITAANPVPVPVPASMGLLSLALGTLVFMRRRRNA